MYYLLAALISAIVGAIPVMLARKPGIAIGQSIMAFFINWLFFYWLTISTAYPLFGIVGFVTLLWWVASAFIASDEPIGWVPVGVGVVLYLAIYFIGTSGMFRASDYASMLGQLGKVEDRVWTQDVQPKDPAHMRMGTLENALERAKAVIGQDGSIGSQFEIGKASATTQKVGNELIVAIPLDYQGYGAWSNTSGVPGYIKVSAEDPHRSPQFITLPKGREMLYTPQAWFGYNLERHLRNNGYLNVGLSDWTFEIDEDGQEWYVVTVFKPTIGFSGEKVTGVVIVNPATGDNKFYPLGQVPEWVDRVVPGSFIKQYLSWYGNYSGGWWNTLPWAANANLTEPAEDPGLIYGTGDQPEWVTDITSTSNADHSLVSLVYTNSRTGKSIRYQMSGGATASKVISVVDTNGSVSNRKLHGAAVQLYNVLGLPIAVVPLLDGGHTFQGVAMVPINDFQTVALGANAQEAQRSLERMLSERDQRAAIEGKRDIQYLEGIVARKGKDSLPSGDTYYLLLVDVPHLFTAGSGISSKITVTEKGDKVKIGFYASDKTDIPMSEFDNLSLQLSKSPLQDKLSSSASKHRSQDEAVEDANTVLERMKNMSPKELQELGKKIPPKK